MVRVWKSHGCLAWFDVLTSPGSWVYGDGFRRYLFREGTLGLLARRINHESIFLETTYDRLFTTACRNLSITKISGAPHFQSNLRALGEFLNGVGYVTRG